MKKLLAIALIAASLTACNNEKKEETPVAPAMDTTAVAAPVAAPADTTAAPADTTAAAKKP
jgi:hypothetical protein